MRRWRSCRWRLACFYNHGGSARLPKLVGERSRDRVGRASCRETYKDLHAPAGLGLRDCQSRSGQKAEGKQVLE